MVTQVSVELDERLGVDGADAEESPGVVTAEPTSSSTTPLIPKKR